MRSGRCEHIFLLDNKRSAHTNDVVCDVLGGRGLVVSDDESPGVMSACDQSLSMAAARQLTFLLQAARRTTVLEKKVVGSQVS